MSSRKTPPLAAKRSPEYAERLELPPLVDVAELADWLRTTPDNIYKLLERGHLPNPMRFAGRKRWRIKDLADAIDRLAGEAADQSAVSPARQEKRKIGRPRKALIGRRDGR